MPSEPDVSLDNLEDFPRNKGERVVAEGMSSSLSEKETAETPVPRNRAAFKVDENVEASNEPSKTNPSDRNGRPRIQSVSSLRNPVSQDAYDMHKNNSEKPSLVKS
jgi:hypothetical protein